MHLESTIIDRVETFVRHPVFAGSDQTMDLVLEDLEAMVEGGRIPQATYYPGTEEAHTNPMRGGEMFLGALAGASG